MPTGRVRPPLIMAATNAVLIVRQGDIEIWSVDIAAVRHRCSVDIFPGVLFREEHRDRIGHVVQIIGIDSPDGTDPGVPSGLAGKQKAFVEFLRRETALENEALGAVSIAFPDSEFSAECEASMAYLAVRSLSWPFVVGFRNRKGEFEVCAIEPGDRNRSDRANVMPYDELVTQAASSQGAPVEPLPGRVLH